MVQRTDVEFEADGGVKLRGWLYLPPGATRRLEWSKVTGLG